MNIYTYKYISYKLHIQFLGHGIKIWNISLTRKWCSNEKRNGFANKSLIDGLEADLQLRGISA